MPRLAANSTPLPAATVNPLQPTARPGLASSESRPDNRQGSRHGLVSLVALLGAWIRANPSWLLSAAFHAGLLAAFSAVLLHVEHNPAPLGIEGSLSETSLVESFERILEAPSVQIHGSEPSSAEQRTDQFRQAADEAAARAARDFDRLGLSGNESGEGGGSGPELAAGFFGSKGEGRSFVYVVDMSQSMAGARFRRALAELVRSINRLKPTQSFYVYFFNDQTFPLYDPRPARGLQMATPANKSRASRWINARRPYSTTDPGQALQRALEMQPDVIFLLTDGELDEPDRVRDSIRQHNKSSVTIHTIAFENK
ncbi:MAG: VWA domain-containing protein [Planctomycetaceae bacterium]|nr:VWA domain-containing protein [Planctomycetaceae bacterium]